jgi:PEP-CTERM motif
MRRVIIGLLATWAFSSLTSSVFADADFGTVTLSLTGAFGRGVTVAPVSSGAEGTIAGPYGYHLSDSTNTSVVPNGDYLGFCIALTENINFNSPAAFHIETLATDLIGETDATKGQIQADNILALVQDFKAKGGSPLSPAAGTLADALTIAIWDVINATAISPASLQIGAAGNIGVSWDPSDPAVIQANKWLNSLYSDVDPVANYIPLYSDANVYALDNVDAVQDQSVVIGFSSGSNGSPVPEPSPFLSLMGMGLLAGAFGWRQFGGSWHPSTMYRLMEAIASGVRRLLGSVRYRQDIEGCGIRC